MHRLNVKSISWNSFLVVSFDFGGFWNSLKFEEHFRMPNFGVLFSVRWIWLKRVLNQFWSIGMTFFSVDFCDLVFAYIQSIPVRLDSMILYFRFFPFGVTLFYEKKNTMFFVFEFPITKRTAVKCNSTVNRYILSHLDPINEEQCPEYPIQFIILLRIKCLENSNML